MSTKKKLIKRFKSLPSDFTFDEIVRLLASLGYEMNNKGATSGSRVEFSNGNSKITIHKPHPGNILNRIVVKRIYIALKQAKLL